MSLPFAPLAMAAAAGTGAGILHTWTGPDHHRHTHQGSEHVHVHAQAPGQGHEPAAGDARPHVHGHAALGFGFLHGLSGASYLWAALPALALPLSGAVAYLSGFAAGCIVAMGCYAGVLGAALERFPDRAGNLHRRVLTAAAGLAMAVGVWWLAGGAI